MLPSRRRQRSHEAMQDTLEVGDEIITAGGLHGVIREAEEDELRVEIAPTVVVTLDRRAVAAVATEVDEELEDDDEADAEDVADGADDGAAFADPASPEDGAKAS